MIYVRSLPAWLALLAAVVLLGAVREVLLEPALGELRAHQIGTVLACAAAFAVSAVFVRRTRPTRGQSVCIGLLWLVLGLAFELGVFRFALGVPWERLLADYRIMDGRLLAVLWLAVLASPALAWRIWVCGRGR